MKTVAAAIDFGTSKIVALAAESGGYRRCEYLGSGTTAYDGMSDGEWNTPEELPSAIRRALSETELESRQRIREVYVGVPGEYIRVRTVEVEVNVISPTGEISEADEEQLQRAAAEKLAIRQETVIYRSLAWYSVDGGRHVMNLHKMRGRRLAGRYSFVTADSAFTEDIRMRLRAMSVGVLAFLSPSVGEALLLLPTDERDNVAVLVDVGYLYTEVIVAEGDAIVYHEVIPMGGGHITADLAYGLETSMHEAEQIKRNFVFRAFESEEGLTVQTRADDGEPHYYDAVFVRQIIEARAEEIADLVREAIGNARVPGSRPVYLTGGGLALMRGGPEFFSSVLGQQVNLPSPKAEKLNSPVYASTLGLIDLVFDEIEHREDAQAGVGRRVASFFNKLMRS